MNALFSAYDLSGLALENRIVMAPMTRSRNADGIPNDSTTLYYRQRAGAGLIVTEGTPISPQGVGYLFTPGLYSAEQVAGWKKVTQAVHDAGGRIFNQLWHVGRISHVSLHDGAAPVGASDKTAQKTGAFAYDEQGRPATVQASRPRALETDEVAGVVRDFADAAANAIEAGFDGVEIHGANGYLIEQFINGGINNRTDRYNGATIEGRLAMVLEVVDAVVARIGAARTGIRLSPFNRIFDMPGFEGEEATWIAVAQALSTRGLAYVHISNRDAIVAMEGGKAFLQRLRAAYTGTLILAGQYTKEEGEADLRDGLGDLIAYGRPFIANPDLVERFKNDWPLASVETSTLYGGGDEGYIDYPVYEAATA